MAEIQDPSYVVNANEAINIILVAPSKKGLQTIAAFKPKFTYSIFGDEEQILGYQDLKINLRYRANDMRPHLSVHHTAKAKGVNEPVPIRSIFEDGHHLPLVAFASPKDFEKSSQQIDENWHPPGTLHKTIKSTDGHFEIWKGSFQDPQVRQLYRRVQLFNQFFIEGGSYIGQDLESGTVEDEFAEARRWTLFFLYQKQKSSSDPEKSSYVFMGFSSVYRYFLYRPQTPPTSPNSDWDLPKGDFDLNELPCRTRLSQFVILPPFQGKGNGVRLYETIFKDCHGLPSTFEFTVEDPNEAFDDLRDVCDLKYLRKIPEFDKLHINTDIRVPQKGPVPRLIAGEEGVEAIRLKAKIAPRQFSRVLEMHLMSQLPDSVRPTMDLEGKVPAPTKSDEHHKKLWQLHVKKRLYKFNRDLLAQIEVSERIDKLQETIQGVELEYARILAACERMVEHSQKDEQVNGKRKLDEDASEGPSKKARVDEE